MTGWHDFEGFLPLEDILGTVSHLPSKCSVGVRSMFFLLRRVLQPDICLASNPKIPDSAKTDGEILRRHGSAAKEVGEFRRKSVTIPASSHYEPSIKLAASKTYPMTHTLLKEILHVVKKLMKCLKYKRMTA